MGVTQITGRLGRTRGDRKPQAGDSFLFSRRGIARDCRFVILRLPSEFSSGCFLLWCCVDTAPRRAGCRALKARAQQRGGAYASEGPEQAREGGGRCGDRRGGGRRGG